jgi:hypothetical protein
MIELTVFYLTDEQMERSEDGDVVLMSECETLIMCFCQIDSFSAYHDEDGNEYSSIWSGGNEWVCKMTYQALLHFLLYGKLKRENLN